MGLVDDAPERVIQFGEGNFLRAFADWHFHELERRGLFHGSVVIVQPLPEGLVDALNDQEGVYTLLRRGLRDGKAVDETDLITVIKRGINPFRDPGELVRCARNPDLRFMVSNTTEAGIVYRPVPKPEGQCPPTFPAMAAMFFYERFRTFDADPAKGLIVLPCELIEANGAELREAILRHAVDWGCGPAFARWLLEHSVFCDTLVDRIVPGHPADEMDRLEARLGYADRMLVASELFHLWVIQGPAAVRAELPFDAAGLNVVWTDSLAPHRTLKVRILNGLHTTLCIPAILSGAETVRGALEDALLGRFAARALEEEILPSLDMPVETTRSYADAVLERFRNPFIKHKLASISMNSVSKFRARVLPSLLGSVEKKGTVPDAMAFSLAALIAFYSVQEREGERTSAGHWAGVAYTVTDEPAVLDGFVEMAGHAGNDPEQLCTEVLRRTDFWGRDLTSVEGLPAKVMDHFEAIRRLGAREALGRFVG